MSAPRPMTPFGEERKRFDALLPLVEGLRMSGVVEAAELLQVRGELPLTLELFEPIVALAMCVR